MPTPRLPFPTTPSEYIQAPTGGWSPDVPTWELPTDAAPLIENFQIKPGKLRVRPGYRMTADLTASHVSPAGWFADIPAAQVFTRRLNGYRIEPQNVHRVGNVSASSVSAAEDAVYVVAGGTVTRSATGAALAPSSRKLDFGASKYAISYSAATGLSLTYFDAVAGYPTLLLNLNTIGSIAVVTGPPIGGFDVYNWLNRMWILGGIPPSPFNVGSIASTNTLFFSNPVSDLAGTSADWTDPVSGLYNQIGLDGNYADFGVALASVPAGLIILRANSVFIIRGTDPTSYVVRPITRQNGCIDARSVVEMDSKVYFMSQQGFMVTDGTTTQNVSGALQDELYRQIATWNNAVFNNTGAWCTANEMSDGKILVTFGTYAAGTSNGYVMNGAFSGVFDPITGAWVRVTTALQPTAGVQTLGPVCSGYGKLTSLGNTLSINIENSSGGTTTSSASSLHDVSNVAGTTFTPITATWITKSPQAALGGRQKIQIKTTYLDHAVSTSGIAATVAYQLTDRVTGGTLATNSITASTNASDPRQYLERDEFHEVSDLGITVTLAGTNTTGAASVPTAEVHGIGLVFSGAADMRPIV